MSLGAAFWILMFLVLLFGGLGWGGVWHYGFWASGVALFLLLAMLGWQAFGAPIRKGPPGP